MRLRLKKILQYTFIAAACSVGTGAALAFPNQVYAAKVELARPLDSHTQIEISNPIQLPHEEVLVSGNGEPGAEVMVQAVAQKKTIFSVRTIIDKKGHWQVIMPALEQIPDHLLIGSEIGLSTRQVVESTTVVGAAAAASFVILQLMAERLLRLLQLAGLLSRRTTRGFVFDGESKQPIPFALLTIESMNKKKNGAAELKETVVSTVDGLFRTLDLPAGKYQIAISHPDYTFPTSQPRPWYATSLEYYRGEMIELNAQNRLNVMFIPLQAHHRTSVMQAHWFNVKVIQSVTEHMLRILSLPMGLLSTTLVIFYPSIINFGLASLYLLLGASELYKRRQHRTMAGTVTQEHNQPVPQAIVQVIQTPPDELVAVLITDKLGRFKINLSPDQYRINVAKTGYIPDQEESKGMSFETISLSKDVKNLRYCLKVPPAFDWTSQSPKI